MAAVKVVMVGYQLRPALYSAVKKAYEITGGKLTFTFFNTYDVDSGVISPERYVEELKSADIALLDIRGGDVVSKLTVDALRGSHKTVVTLVGGSPELIALTKMGSFQMEKVFSLREKPFIGRLFKRSSMDYGSIVRMRDRFEKLGRRLPIGIFKHARNYSLILKYYDNPDERNYLNMLLLLLRDYGGVKVNVEISEPQVAPSMGIQDFDTGRIFEDVDSYLSSYKHRDRPLVGVLFYGGFHYDQSVVAAKLLVENLEGLGLGAIPVFCSDLRYYLALEKFFLRSGKPLVDVVVDLLWFRFAGGPVGGDHSLTFNVLSRMGIPVLHGVHLSSITVDQWLNSRSGIPPTEVVTTVVLPELDGRIEPIVTHAPVKRRFESVELEEYTAIEDRVERVARRALKWVNLRRKRNSEKKIAIILYNYPPGEENLGKAAYINTFASLERILKAMRERGYDIHHVPSEEELKDMLLRAGAVNSGEWVLTTEAISQMPKVPLEVYSKWLEELPESVREDIARSWGPPPGGVMTYKDCILIPGISLGKVFIGVQPSRGVHEDPSKAYHSRDLPPHHQYVAFYEWIKRVFGADAVVHLGTHGTLEFLPGKDSGLSRTCFPDVLIGDLPNVYVYHVVNSSEAAIAKRRSYAVIVNHRSPPITTSGVHNELAELERLLDQYYEVAQYHPEKARHIADRVLKLAEKFGLGGSVEEIHDKVYEYKRALIPRGLHVLGAPPSEDELIDYLTSVARYDREGVKSLHGVLAESMGLDYYELLEKPSAIIEGGRRSSQVLEEIDGLAREVVRRCVIRGERLERVVEELELRNVGFSDLSRSVEYFKEVKENMMSSQEIENVLKALEGCYIPPGPGGDPIRSPSVFPTGRNTFQLDPANIPTDIASERGERIAEEFLRRYYEKHGRYPRVVSVVLWAFETMKTGGETIAAIFRLIGVKPIWKTPYIRDLQVIPLRELGRPRIDVLVTICGIFRDTFYNLVELLDKAFKLVASLDEPPEENYVKANFLSEREELGEDAIVRIFGPPEGSYATTLTNLIESGAWRSELDLVNAYLDSMRYAYGEKTRGKASERAFNAMLSRVDVVAQVRDTVEYEITDLDHYYEFLGGLSRSVEEVKGERPMVFVADTTRERVKVEGIGEVVRRGVVTRLLNPKWLEGMLNHGFTGAAKIADRVEYMLGLAATTRSIENWMWDQAAEKIVFNEEIAERIKRENPWALGKIVKRLFEAHVRGYWEASSDVLERLKRLHQDLEAYLEEGSWRSSP